MELQDGHDKQRGEITLSKHKRGVRKIGILVNQRNANCDAVLSGSIAGPRALCASPEKQVRDSLLEATAMCGPSPLPSSTAKPQLLPPLGPAGTQQPLSLYNKLTATLTPSYNHMCAIKCEEDGYIEDLYIADYGTAGRRGYSSVTM
uniref:Uncharacterized protein n=1 Tax=Myripristis murdjan TaxID=586833 RepID=A0A668AUN0_9TELE